MYQIEEPKYFYLLIGVAFVLVMYGLVVLWKRRKQKQFADLNLLDQLSPERSVFKPALKVIMVALGLAFLVVALVNPKMGTQLKTVKRQGVDIVFAIDVSKSMLAEDIAPNRLDKSKQIVSKIIEELGSDRVGIIIYAGNAYPLLPITTDHSAARMFLQNAHPDMVSSQGTAINEALNLAKTFFDDDTQTNRFLFVISDGEDHEENSAETAKQLVDLGIKTYTIGIGTNKGSPIPIKRNGKFVGYKKDRDDEVVITKLSVETLKEIAENGDGSYIYGNRTSSTIEYVEDLLLKADKKEFETTQFADYKDQFQWFVAFGLLFLLLDVFLLDKKTKWIQKLNLFNEK
jgi:Ca-activated chloride channel family protein